MDEKARVVLASNEVVCSELTEDSSSLILKFIICSFRANDNDTKLNRLTVEKWLHTLKAQPLVGKLGVSDSGEADFTSHNMNTVTRVDEHGELYQGYAFDTLACGAFTDVSIEQIDGEEHIVATAKLWKRFPEFCAVVKKRFNNGSLKTSWEINVLQSHYEYKNSKRIKVIDNGCFIGHCLLGAYVPPAFQESQLLEIAAKEDNELIEALNKDFVEISNIKTKKEEEVLENEKTQNKQKESGSGKIDTSALTARDLHKAVRDAIAKKLTVDRWDFYTVYDFPADGVIWIHLYDAESELDIIKFSYTVTNDVLTLGEPEYAKISASVCEMNQVISQKDEALVKANETIQALKGEVASLTPFKELCEKADRERVEAELSQKKADLKAKIEKSNLFTKKELVSKEVSSLIESADEEGVKNLIADKFMASLDSVEQSTVVEGSDKIDTASAKANIDNEDIATAFSIAELISAYSKK